MKQKQKQMFSIFAILMLVFVAVPVLADDDDRDDDKDDDDREDREDKRDREDRRRSRTYPTFIRAVHLSPDAPDVDILANDGLFIKDLEFEEASRFKRVPADTYNLKVVPNGATEPVVIEADLPLKAWRLYSVLAVNTLDSIEPIVIEDRIKWIPRNKALVRFVHASPDAPSVDIAVQDGPVLFSDVEFKEVEDFLEVGKGSYDLEVRLAGTDTVVLSLDDIRLRRGTQYTVFATGLVSDGSLDAEVVRDRRSVFSRWNRH